MSKQLSRIQKLDFAERWLRVVLLELNRPATFFQVVDVDMSKCKILLQTLKSAGIPITYTHMLVHAVALALDGLPQHRQLVYGNRRIFPAHVNLSVVVAAGGFAAPSLRILKTEQKNLLDIVNEIVVGAPRTRAEGEKQLAFLRKWGWIVPCDCLRRQIMRILLKVDRRLHPDDLVLFGITTSPGVDQFGGFLLDGTGKILSGIVREKIVHIEGQSVVRPMWTLTSAVNHLVWDGRMAQTFLLRLKNILETASLVVPENIVKPLIKDGL
jgi:hypothetical protein